MDCFLTDFGLAKSVETGSRVTRTGQALGTPAYMSPEQARGEVNALTPAADVWSLGCVLHEMLAGSPPFGGDTPAAVIAGVIAREPAPLRSARPDLPRDLGRVAAAALAKRTRDRYATGEALREDLDRVLRGARPAAPRPGSARRLAAAAALVSVTAAGGGLLMAHAGAGPDESRAPAVHPSPGDARVADRAAGLATRARAVRASDLEEAARLLAEALSLEPGRHDRRLERGLALWAAGRGTEAREEWSRIPPEAPESASARLYGAIEAFSRLGDRDVAQVVLAAREGTNSPLLLAACSALERDWAEARRLLEGARGWEASLVRGYVENTDPRGDPAVAVRQYDEALREGIPFSWALHNRGLLRQSLGDLDGALADFDAALVRPHDRSEVLAARGTARCQKGDTRSGLADLDAALEARPDLLAALANRANARIRSGDVAGGLADLDRAVQSNPDDLRSWRSRAEWRLNLADAHGSFRDFDEALRRSPRDLWALDGRSRARRALGDLPCALADYEAAFRISPKDPVLLRNRAVVHKDRGDLRAALADLDEADRVEPRNAHTLTNRSNIRLELGDASGALADAQTAVSLEPDRDGAWLNLAVAREALEDAVGAAEAFREFLRLSPTHPQAENVRRHLAEVPEQPR
ncbi:MAG: tetratricopeptide repeat protein [Planctomycetales bacterium]|nr:tetratricopeptide repeat protein [Planctomycetales bacterium]